MVNNSININNMNKIVHVLDIGDIVDHHCLEAIVHVVDIGGIVNHHWLEAIVHVVDIGGKAEMVNNSTNINNMNNRL
jgi:hypothetical protein